MHVHVRLFAALRERAGSERIELELPAGARVADALSALEWLTGGLRVVMAVNREYADADAELRADDELALIPPVSGGAHAGARMHVRVHERPLGLDALVERVKDPRAGGLVAFLGMTREVDHLDYEAYVEMAETTIAEIVEEAVERHGLCAAAVEHRIGRVPLSEPSIAIAASAPHRAAAFAGAREILDRVKRQAPIWKKEDGQWVEGATPGQQTVVDHP
jgi:molybdopterin synthase catalytic subunit